ncbi:MAG: hypothetical protein ACODAA_00620 [Gemmatimonadota bacterium]
MRRFILVIALLLATPGAPPAQETSGGFLFSYRPHEGERSAFEEGYRAHLDWHRAHQDSLVWYGWDVLAGPRLGQFVDGAFGMRFAALDERVDPGGDAEDAAETFRPHGTATARELLLLRPDLSTATPLEELTPRPFVQVVRYAANPGTVARLERALEAVRQVARPDSLLAYTVYEIVAGAEPGFLLMVWRDGMGSFDQVDRNPERALRYRIADWEDAATIDVTRELWRYRPDLSYLGLEEDG